MWWESESSIYTHSYGDLWHTGMMIGEFYIFIRNIEKNLANIFRFSASFEYTVKNTNFERISYVLNFLSRSNKHTKCLNIHTKWSHELNDNIHAKKQSNESKWTIEVIYEEMI